MSQEQTKDAQLRRLLDDLSCGGRARIAAAT